MNYETRYDGPGLESECKMLVYYNRQLTGALEYAVGLLSDIIGEDSPEVESLRASIEFFGIDETQ